MYTHGTRAAMRRRASSDAASSLSIAHKPSADASAQWLSSGTMARCKRKPGALRDIQPSVCVLATARRCTVSGGARHESLHAE